MEIIHFLGDACMTFKLDIANVVMIYFAFNYTRMMMLSGNGISDETTPDSLRSTLRLLRKHAMF